MSIRLFCILSLALAAAGAEKAELISVTKIWDKGPHNAFTDLIRFQDGWFCAFRESEEHVGGDGRIRILESEDGGTWTSAALIAEEGVDLRDPKLSITPDGRLMTLAGGSVYKGKTYMGRQSRVAFSEDAREWTAPQRIIEEGEWLWRVTWHKGKGYGATRKFYYDAEGRHAVIRLMVTEDGIGYHEVTRWDEIDGWPNETTIRFDGDEMIAMVRREKEDTHGWIGTSRPPYTEWKWHETGHRFGGPDFIILPDGAMWAGSRYYPGGAKTVLARMTRDSYKPALTLPSGGDTSYPGFVWHEGMLWMSYYSSHEGKTSIYLAKIRLS
jgi:hypothetical protein